MKLIELTMEEAKKCPQVIVIHRYYDKDWATTMSWDNDINDWIEYNPNTDTFTPVGFYPWLIAECENVKFLTTTNTGEKNEF